MIFHLHSETGKTCTNANLKEEITNMEWEKRQKRKKKLKTGDVNVADKKLGQDQSDESKAEAASATDGMNNTEHLKKIKIRFLRRKEGFVYREM